MMVNGLKLTNQTVNNLRWMIATLYKLKSFTATIRSVRLDCVCICGYV